MTKIETTKPQSDSSPAPGIAVHGEGENLPADSRIKCPRCKQYREKVAEWSICDPCGVGFRIPTQGEGAMAMLGGFMFVVLGGYGLGTGYDIGIYGIIIGGLMIIGGLATVIDPEGMTKCKDLPKNKVGDQADGNWSTFALADWLSSNHGDGGSDEDGGSDAGDGGCGGCGGCE